MDQIKITASAALVVLAFSACMPGKEDGLCAETPFDPDVTSAAATEAIERTNMYRSMMNIEAGTLDPLLNKASQAHADYMACHETITHQEDADDDGFSGEWVWDRMEAAGYPMEAGHLWSEVIAEGYSATEAIDGWVGSVYHRIPFTQPYWIEAGFGLTDRYAAMAIVTPYPDGPRTGVIYPVDGQTDVPIDFNSDWEIPDPDPERGIVGHPISVTVSAETSSGGIEDPYGLRLLEAVLSGPSGDEIAVVAVDPSDDSDLYTMAAMWPEEPLEPSTEYDAVMTVEWDGGQETFVTTFTTAP